MADTVDKIKSSIASSPGVDGFLGIDQIDWGGSAGAVYECWKLSPCCGSPFNLKDCLYCLGCFYFCPLCTASKLLASSLEQQPAIVNHCLLTYCGAFYYCKPCIRHNFRKKAGAKGNIIGDCVCACVFPYCSACQELRSVPISAWDWLPDVQAKNLSVFAPEFRLMI